ncbi:MAG: hypothetical protein JSS24_07605 [Proteobacteria bacterium]|nr:hypothetical protein [Pseudomonadota bacterium]
MRSNLRMAATAAVALLMQLALSPAARADELSDLKADLAALKAAYEQKIAALEARIAQLETKSSAAESLAAEAPPPPAPPPSSGGGQTAFNPSVSVILAGNYANLSQDPASYRIAGFMTGGAIGPGERSFNLDESELTFNANVDPYFMANLTAAIEADDSIHAEEAYFKTLALPHGLLLKAGRFFSGIGYLNEVHSHAWDFIDQPLVYQAFLGSQYATDGAQVKWLAPTDVLLEFGAETGNGRQFPGTGRHGNGMNSTALFAHAGNDIGDSASWRAGLSWLDQHAQERSFETTDATGTAVLDAFTGRSRLWGADFTFKWAPHGNSVQRQFKFQAEYMQRREAGNLAFDTLGTNVIGDYHSTQSGWYAQTVYQFRPRWRAGLRYDSLHSGDPAIGLVSSGLLPMTDFADIARAHPERLSVMLDFSPSEFSRLRLQYAYDEARREAIDHQLFLQYLFSIGAHGAHKY